MSKNLIHNNIFDDVFKDSLLIHIPHSGNYIPNDAIYTASKKVIKKEINKLSDFGTDTIFDLGQDVSYLKFPYNRVYCDVERLPDELEVMYRCGRGFYYTKTDCGQELRGLDDKEKVKIIFDNYHHSFAKKVNSILDRVGSCTIIDCHSFSDKPFSTDLIQEDNRPDFCLGTDNFHTPDWLIGLIRTGLENEGYSVKINNPYSGTIVPLEFYQKDVRVRSIMIEVNRKLFLGKKGIPNEDKMEKLNKVIKNIFR